jgi:ADP-ribosylglycohydrolase
LSHHSSQSLRVANALKTAFIADALAMPVHWFYRPIEIELAFPGGIQQFEAAPEFHPSSIMSLHSKRKGGRQSVDKSSKTAIEVVGDVILKDKAQFWDKPNMHYHQGMAAGENTLNAHCARLMMRVVANSPESYDRQKFANAYIAFMTAEPARHPDTYAESYHRGFFAHFAQGRKPEKCAMKTHDTASIGGLITIAPLVFSERLRGSSESAIQITCREHLALTHPDESLMRVCDRYVTLLCGLMVEPDQEGVKALLIQAGKGSPGLDVAGLVKRNLPDNKVIGQLFSPACYISDSWPIVLYLAYKYLNDPWKALIVNTNLGGDNAHRGNVLGILLGLQSDTVANNWFEKLLNHNAIGQEIDALVNMANNAKL